MEKDILKNDVENFIDASVALTELAKNISIDSENCDLFTKALEFIMNNKNELFKDLK